MIGFVKSKATLVALLFSILSLSAFSQRKQICITVDDLPVVSYSISENHFLEEITKDLLATFDQFKIPAIGYVNEGKLYSNGVLDANKVALLDLWLKNGLELGNHTYSHKNYDKSTFEEYTGNILKGEQVTANLCKAYSQPLRYFRHPYLRIGNTKEKHERLNKFLKQHGYIEAPVTIDNEDYLFALAYHRSYIKNDKETMQKIGKEYVDYMERKLHYFEKSSKTLFGRNIKQILLIHSNLLNSHYFAQLARMYQRNGYDFISQEDALKDAAYNTPITKYGNWGISWLDRWAMSKGFEGGFFKDDPPTPDYIKELTQ